jgi:hypothetical protein
MPAHITFACSVTVRLPQIQARYGARFDLLNALIALTVLHPAYSQSKRNDLDIAAHCRDGAD